MTIVLYTFSKRPDSTKRPSSGGRSLSATLKEATSILYPSFLFQFSGNPTVYNYAYVPDFDRYYYITDWTSTAGLWDASCKVDVLASWKENIGASRQYVLRAEAESDGYISDALYTLTSLLRTEKVNPVNGMYPSECEYLVGVIGSDSDNLTGGVTYYVFTEDEFKGFLAVYLNIGKWSNFIPAEWAQETFMAVFNPMQYITCVYKYPAGVLPVQGLTNDITIKAGWWSIGVIKGHYLNVNGNALNFVFSNIPEHPKAGTRGYYLNTSPYSTYVLWMPPFGEIRVDGSIIGENRSISCAIFVDPVSNTATLDITGERGQGGFYRSAFGANVQLSQVQTDWGALVGAGSDVVNAGTNRDHLGFLGVPAAIANGVMDTLPKARSVGSNSDFSQFQTEITLYCKFQDVTDEDIDGRGRPLCKTRRISDLPGFVQVSDAKIAFNCTSSETTEIKNFMEGGFHYE